MPRTAGIDLAAQPANTAGARIRWHGGGADVEDVAVGVDDAAMVQMLVRPDTITGIDCPLGWPSGFVAFVTDHQDDALAADIASEPGWKRRLVNRATDLAVHERVGLVPLSVAADRIGHAALRCAAVLAQARVRGVDVARDGSGAIAEVYPAAALKTWGLPHRGYKGAAGEQQRGRLLAGLREQAPWLELGEFGPLMLVSDHALDAVVCALVARAVDVGATYPPTTRAAAREGWIHVPHRPLSELVG